MACGPKQLPAKLVHKLRFWFCGSECLSAAFNIVNHQILLSTFSGLWVTGRSYQVEACICACLANISTWISAHHLKLNKTELLFLQGKACLLKHFSITVDNSEVSPSQSAKNLGPSVGLVCQNNEQGLQQKCFDYEIRVKCCKCLTTTHIPTTETTTVPHITTPTPTTTTSTSTAPPTTKTSTQTPSPSTTPTTTPTSTSTGVTPTKCSGEETCVWSDWINLGQPTSGSEGGDNESIKNIIAAGYHICSAPEAVECRAKQYPGLQISQLGQDVTCNPSVGLVCQNNEQGLQQKCFDYEIRVKCCKCGTTTHIPTTATTTVPHTTTPTPTTTTSTSTAPPTTKTSTQTPSPSTTPTTTPTSTSTGVTPTKCSGEETCVWSDWINLGQPTSGSEGGDNESIKNIIAAGYHICSAPEAVECRAKQYPGLQISQLGQDVTCNPSVGLVCQNNEQGLQQKCFDYEIRVKCCKCGTTTHIPTTANNNSSSHHYSYTHYYNLNIDSSTYNKNINSDSQP
ncbi:mucin-2 [Oncorhynchus tshawytscha]|uniref:mucin-2 n=1 Tax=Oncorhynchus tshawytscha TaxID=74940 RepID=UPI001C3D6DB9|nr:mucin-2 [Oncorhynchus tshawytscha]